MAAYRFLEAKVMAREWHREAALEHQEYLDRDLLAAGYQFGLAVERFYDQPGQRKDACRQLAFAEEDFQRLGSGIDSEYVNGKLTGLVEMRSRCQ